MADRLTADQFEQFSDVNIRRRPTRSLTLDNSGLGSPVDITSRVRKWGTLKTTIYNKHPGDRGKLEIPVITIEVDNSDGYFDVGGSVFPTRAAISSATARVVVAAGGSTWLDFEGHVAEPEIDPSGIYNLVIEHPMVALTSRQWIRDDRIGGDTGFNFFFDS